MHLIMRAQHACVPGNAASSPAVSPLSLMRGRKVYGNHVHRCCGALRGKLNRRFVAVRGLSLSFSINASLYGPRTEK